MRYVLAVALALSCSTAQPSAKNELAPFAHPLTGQATDYDPLLRAVGGAALVLLGEATHGTHEFYVERSRITQRLIKEKGFTAVALEADWADASRVDRYVRGLGNDKTAEEALGGFERFPRWMWRNAEFAELVRWIRAHNDALPANAPKVGVYGLDLYGMGESTAAVVEHLRTIDPAAADVARTRYECFAKYREEPEEYGYALGFRRTKSCEPVARQQFDELRARIAKVPATDTRTLDELFFAEQNARVVKNAEEMYREMATGRVSTWNLRDRHMVATMDALQKYLLKRYGRDHIVVWAHNSHVGDARATDRARHGEFNIGQLVREHWPRGASYTVGFATNTGTVIAADDWGAEGHRKNLNPAIRGSHGAILHEVGIPRFLLLLGEVKPTSLLRRPRQQRAVGVIYRPMTELESHYFSATLQEQFDAVIHIDQTTALKPL